MTTGGRVWMSEQNQSGNGDADFAKQYADRIVERLFATNHWSVADLLFRECPKEHLEKVAFIFLDEHFTVHPFAKRGDFH